jgi:hypothetical protein
MLTTRLRNRHIYDSYKPKLKRLVLSHIRQHEIATNQSMVPHKHKTSNEKQTRYMDTWTQHFHAHGHTYVRFTPSLALLPPWQTCPEESA